MEAKKLRPTSNLGAKQTYRSQSNNSLRSARRENKLSQSMVYGGNLNQSMMSLKTERVTHTIDDSEYIDPIHKFDEEPKSMAELQKKFQTRLEFFKDFY